MSLLLPKYSAHSLVCLLTVNWNSSAESLRSSWFALFRSVHQHHRSATAVIFSSCFRAKIAWRRSKLEQHSRRFILSCSGRTVHHTFFRALHRRNRCPLSSNRVWQMGHRVSRSTCFLSIFRLIGRLSCPSRHRKWWTLAGHSSFHKQLHILFLHGLPLTPSDEPACLASFACTECSL